MIGVVFFDARPRLGLSVLSLANRRCGGRGDAPFLIKVSSGISAASCLRLPRLLEVRSRRIPPRTESPFVPFAIGFSSSTRRSPLLLVDSFILVLTSTTDLPVKAATLLSSGVLAVTPWPFVEFLWDVEEAGLARVVSTVCAEF